MQSHVAIVRRSHELFDEGRVDEWLELFTEDVEVPALALFGTESLYRGREGLRRWFHELNRSRTRVRSIPDRVLGADERRVVVTGRIVVDEAGGGYGSVAGWVYTFDDEGCIQRIEVHPHPDGALRAAGLDAEAGRA